MSELRSADMNATVDVGDLTALMPESRPIAQLYTDSGTAVDRGAGHLERQPGCSKLLQFPNRGATVKNLDIRDTIAARSIKTLRPPLRHCRGKFPRRGTPRIRSSKAAVVNCIPRNSPQANRHSRRTRTKRSYLQIYETS